MLVFCSFWSKQGCPPYLNWVIAACKSSIILFSDDVVQLTTFSDSTVCSQIACTGHPVPLFYINQWHHQNNKTLLFMFLNLRRPSDSHPALALNLVSYRCLHWAFLLHIFKVLYFVHSRHLYFADTSVSTVGSVLYSAVCYDTLAIPQTPLKCIRKCIKLQPTNKQTKAHVWRNKNKILWVTNSKISVGTAKLKDISTVQYDIVCTLHHLTICV